MVLLWLSGILLCCILLVLIIDRIRVLWGAGNCRSIRGLHPCRKASDCSSSRQESEKSERYPILEQLGYTVDHTLGHGSYSVVKRAFSKRHKRNVAVKIISKQRAASSSMGDFYRKEIAFLRRLTHKNVVCMLQALESTHRVYIVMSLVAQQDMLEYLQQHGRLTEHEARALFVPIAEGLKHLHMKGIAHRDLKCENILLTKGLEPVITDLGFAKEVAGFSDLSQTFCGSFAYAAPEILQGIPYAPRVADVWSLGVILYILVFNYFPFDDSSVTSLKKDATSGFIHFSSKINISAEVEDLIKKMMNVDLNQRLNMDEILNHPWLSLIL